MKKFLSIALAACAFAHADAQYIYTLPYPDTLRINQTSGVVKQYLSTDVDNIDFSDSKKIVINTNDGKSTSYYRSSIDNMRFYNRYSNPNTLLKTERFGAYEGLFRADNCRKFDTYYLVACLASDDMLGGGGIQDYWPGIDYLTSVPNHFLGFEQATYETIGKINELIKKVDQMPAEVDQKVINHTKGEMLFLRAYHNYELASLQENIQIITDNENWEQKLKSYTTEEIWGHIMLDLKNAIDLMDASLCPSLKEDGRVSRYAAEAMLARAFLFYTGFYQGKHDIASLDASVKLPDGSQLTKQTVIDYLSEIISQSPFRLVNDFRNIWPYTNRYTVEANPETAGLGLKWVEDDGAINPEVLFKIRYNTNARWDFDYGPGYANVYALYFGHRIAQNTSDYIKTFPMGGGWGAGTVNPGLWDDWKSSESGDMRRMASIQDMQDKPFSSEKNNAQLTQYHEKKITSVIGRREAKNDYSWNVYDGYEYDIFELWMFHPDEFTLIGNTFQGGSIHPLNLIRLADVMLMHSELTGTVDGINQVRKRAGLQPIESYSLEALQQERRWELAFEGVRWNDMRRWGDDYCKKALDRQLNQPIIYCGTKTTNTPNTVLGNSAFPIPGSYSEQYEQTHGFFKPSNILTECREGYKVLNGTWTYGELNGITYGTLKYKGASAKNFVDKQQGLIEGYSLSELKQQVNATAMEELSEFARMSIVGNTIVKISANGDTLAEGTITLNETFDYNWRICSATISNGATLFGNGCSKFDIIKLDDKLVLVDANSATQGASAQFWVFRTATSGDFMMYGIGNKKWSYAVDQVYNMGSWGVGNTQASGTYLADLIESVSPDQLATKAAEWGIADTRDADLYAYMQFNLVDKTVSKFTRDGKLIATGAFEWRYENSKLYIKVQNNATLFPYYYYGQGDTVDEFLVCYNDYHYYLSNSFTEGLVFQDANNEEQLTYWLFAQRGFTAEELAGEIVIRQYDKNNQPAANGCYFTISFKDGQKRDVSVACTDGTRIVDDENGLKRVFVEAGGTIQKELRFSITNRNNDVVSICRTLTFKMDPKPAKEVTIWSNPVGFTVGAWDASAMRFSNTEGKEFPSITCEQYEELCGKELHISVKEASPDATVQVMNGWWSPIYYDKVPFVTGEDCIILVTEGMVRDCSKCYDGKDLVLMLTQGTATISKVYYKVDQ